MIASTTPSMLPSTPFSRRSVLQAAGLGAALIAANSAERAEAQDGLVQLTFAFPPDASGSTQALLDGFNQLYAGQIAVSWREMPANYGEYFSQVRTELQAGSEDLDVIGIGGIWPAPLGVPGLIADLGDRLDTSKFLPSTIAINTYKDAIYGAPWYTDCGLLYYRKDLLTDAGFSAPPATWAELSEMVTAIQSSTGIQAGYLLQGAETPAGAINAIEFIYSSGGYILDPSDPETAVVNQPEAIRGLQIERGLIDNGIAPQAVTTYGEQECEAAFLRGDAIFMRNWPGSYESVSDPNRSVLSLEQVGVGQLPVAEAGLTSRAIQSGIQLAMNAKSRYPDEAWMLIDYLSSAEQQKAHALQGGQLPAVASLYDDPELTSQLPIMALGQQALANSLPRPVTPYIFEMSNLMAERFTTMLSGGATPEETAAGVQSDLQEIIDLGGV